MHTELIQTDHGEIRVRVEQSFYAVDENGHTIDGPFQSKEDAVETGRRLNILREKSEQGKNQ